MTRSVSGLKVKNKKARGFTIVELLVVIVVIAILAAISIVAYNGIQARTRNDQTISAVRAYMNGIRMYAADYGHPPQPSDSGMSGLTEYDCLGENYSGGACWDPLYPTVYKQNTAFNTAMKNYLGTSLPMPSSPSIRPFGAIYVYGLSDSQWQIDGSQSNWIIYPLEPPATSCPVGPIASKNGTTYSSTPPATGYTMIGAGSIISCFVPLYS